MRRRLTSDDDSGAVLVLALLFVLVVGLVGGALVGFAGSSLAQTSSLNSDRSQSYAAESAVQVAIQTVRTMSKSSAPGYSTGSTPNPCPTTSLTIPENTVGGTTTNESFDVMCAVGEAPLPFERQIVFAACPSGTSAANCLAYTTTGPSAFVPKPQPAAIVVATTMFADLKQGCHFFTSPTDTCFAPGTSVDTTAWDVAKSNS